MKMHCLLTRVTLLALLLAPASPLRAEPDVVALEEQAFKEAAALVEPSIVRVQTVGGLDTVNGILTPVGPTTGVVVSPDGYVISSAFNFVAKPASVLVQLPDGRQLPAQVVATDRSKMLTLLKIEATGLTPAPAAEKDAVRVGQWALAMGRTYENESPSVSVGIVSALNRIWGRAIQTDAKVSPINYGGPLVNVEGKVLGVIVPLSPQEQGETAGVEWYDGGIGFAIPMQDVYAAVERLKSGEDLKHGLLGISFKGGESLTAEDVTIDRVRPESPAAKAGLKVGDVVTEVDGKTIARPADALHALGGKYAGDEVTVVAKRGDETIRQTIKLVAELTAYESGFLGILPLRDGTSAEPQPGVGVRFVFEDSPAAGAGIKPRDRIAKIGDDEVTDAAMLLDRVSRIRPGESVRLTWRRGDEEQSADVKLASIPTEVPKDLPTSAAPAYNLGGQLPRTGRFNGEVPGHEGGYWAFVPDDYNPDYPYGLMVWTHPGGDTMEAEVFKEWQGICERRGVMILAPKAANLAGWTPEETEFVKDAVEEFRKTYTVDPRRIFLHGHSNGGTFAWQLAFKHRGVFRGVAATSAPLRSKPDDNSPDHRQQFFVITGEKDPLQPMLKATVEALRKMKFPVSFTTVPGAEGQYPPSDAVEELGRWADMLDRI